MHTCIHTHTLSVCVIRVVLLYMYGTGDSSIT